MFCFTKKSIIASRSKHLSWIEGLSIRINLDASMYYFLCKTKSAISLLCMHDLFQIHINYVLYADYSWVPIRNEKQDCRTCIVRTPYDDFCETSLILIFFFRIIEMSAKIPPTQCMYHGNRVQFAVLTTELRKNRVIPKQYLTRLASAVCSCRRHSELLIFYCTCS